MNQKLKVAMARPLSLKRRAATLLLLAFVSFTAVWAQVSYRKYNTETGEFETKTSPSNVTTVTSGLSSMGSSGNESWYVVNNNVAISNRIECAGTVNLILCDGATFKANAGMHVKSGTNLNVYAQSGGTGSLIATQGTVDISCVGGNSAETSGEITIHGGIISITCAGRAAAIGGGWYGNASKTVIHGGKVTARCQGEYGCAIGGGLNGGGGTVIITGGEVLAEGLGRASSGIGAGSLWAIGGNVTITGGTVVAKSGKDAKAIGGGIWVEQDGTVNLVDMIVYASEDSNEPVANEERINTCRSAYVKLVHCDNHSFNDNGDCIYCAARAWYTVAYDGNGNTEGDAPVDETRYCPGQNTTVTVLGIPDNFKRTGYMFVGWNTMADGNGTHYAANATFTISQVITLYAQWEKVYTIAFDANGGTGAPEAQTKTEGEDLTLATTVPTRTGFNFLGWNTMADGTGDTYAAGATYTANAAVTLYAQWEDIRERYILTYDANGGTGAPEAQTKIKGEDLTLATTVPTREGYKFVGWKALNTHDYVDLGLSVLWATCNLGAEKSEDYGNYYVWGETEDKNSYGWETYKYCQGTENSITKYNDTDGLTELELTDDAAYVNWGSAWRIPSEKEWQELVNNTESAWTTENGVNGYKFTASNGNYIFLPAAGAHSKSRLFDDGGQGHYASRTLKYPISTWQLNFVPTYVVVDYYAREYGYTVRPVTDGRGGTIYAAGDTYTTNSNVTLCAQWEKVFVPDGDGIYHIASIEDWNIFAEMVNNSVTFSGKVVKLDCNNIEVTTMVGTSSQKFEGTFDGCGNTLDINYSSSAQYCAPFSYVNNATFKDLNITGSITTSQKFAASIAGSASGTTTVTGCSSTVSITSSVGGDGTHGGFIGIAENNSTTNFTDCVFRGKLLGASTTYNGGFLGYVRSGSSSYTNCLFDPAELTMSTSGSCTFNRNTTPTMSGAYYTQTFGEAQGVQVFSEVPSKSLYKSLSIMGYNFFRTCDISGVNDFYECTGSAITPALSVKFEGTELSADDYSVTFTHNGALANEVKEAGEYTMTVTANEGSGYCGTWSKTFKVCFGHDAEGNYIIANNDDWRFFASKITNGETFSGKTVKLASDEVTVTERVPSTFAGTFDGCGKTLTVNLSGGNEELAIFTTISNATIQNLHITGTIKFARHRPASIASYVAGTSTVKNCWSDVDIISNYTPSSLDWVDGGALIARVNNGCTLNMSDCRFTGTFVYLTNNHEGGGMVGWTQDANATANLTNCLYAPTSLTMTKENTKQLTYIFVSGNKRGILTNCFYNGVAANTTVLKKEGTRVFDEPQTTLCKKVTLFGTDYYAQCDVLGVEDYYCYNEGQTIELDPKVFAGSDVMTSEDYTLTMTYNGASVTEVKERGEYTITIAGNNENNVFGTWSKTFHVIGVDCDTDGNYIIANADDWNTFATMVANVESFSGKTVKLANSDITVTTMVGTEANPFCGTFDGGGNTLTFNYSTDADNAAPFQWIKNATIKNMTVTGEVTTSKMFAAGFVARSHGDNAIENCVSSVTIHASKNGDGTHGGFVGRIENDCKMFTFTNCLFNGTFDGSNTDNWCPFAAWSMGNGNTNFVFNDCLYAPTSVNVRNGNATIYRNGTPTLNGAYYTQALGTVQGTQVFTEVQTSLCKKVTLFGTDYYAACSISGVQDTYVCIGDKPVNVGLVVTCGGKTLAETDYTIAYTCNGEAVDAVTKRGEYVMTIAGNEEAGCYGTATAHFTVLTDEDVFIVNYDLKDSYGDGWNGCAINVVDKASGITFNTLTIAKGSSASGHMELAAGTVYDFVWVSGRYSYETSWTFRDSDGDELFSGNGTGLSDGKVLYQLYACPKPSNLTVAAGASAKTLTLGWTSYEGLQDSWDVAYKAAGDADFTIVEGVTQNPCLVTDVEYDKEYTFKVRCRKTVNGTAFTNKWSDAVTYTLPVPEITLANNADNSEIIEAADGKSVKVTLADRTIYRDGDWNTIVLPFEVDLNDETCPLYGATARTLASASLTNNGQTLTLNFDEPVTRLEAGVPYIIKWTEKCETDIVTPVFPYVTIDATDGTFCSDDHLVRFCGTYDLVTFDDENKDVLFLGSGNNLYYPDGKATTTIGACRAYFKIGNDDFVADATQLRSIVMDFGEESETVSIENLKLKNEEEIWFTLDGRRAKGNGRGMVVKTGSKRFVK